MSTTEYNHISPDRLEEAVRGHLSPADMETVRTHCAICERCRRAYDGELQIAAGTRAWARDAMKQRLTSRVAHLRRNRIPWSRVLATAALIVVVAGVGIIYQWSQTGKETVPAFTDNVQQQSEPVARENRQAPATASEKQDISGYIAQKPRTGAGSVPNQTAPSTRADERALLKTTRLPEEPIVPPLAVAEQADAESATLVVGRSGEMILWGTPVRTTQDEKKKAEETREAEVLRDKSMPDRMGTSREATAKSAVLSPTYIIEQRVQEPGLRGLKDGLPGSTAAGLVRSGDTVYVTLFLDTLLTPAEMRSVFVRECPPDSLQIVLPGGTTIGYRTPSGYLR